MGWTQVGPANHELSGTPHAPSAGSMTAPSAVDIAHETLHRIANAALATVSAESVPWNSPVFVAFDGRAFYWISYVDAVHSRNIAANDAVFLVIFDSTAADHTGQCVYVRATARALTDERAIGTALESLARRKREAPRRTADFMAPSDRRVYEAVPTMVWTNVVHEQADRVFDERVTIALPSQSAGHDPKAGIV